VQVTYLYFWILLEQKDHPSAQYDSKYKYFSFHHLQIAYGYKKPE